MSSRAGPLQRPADRSALPLLRASDASVVLDGRVKQHDAEFALTTFAVDGGELIVPGLHGRPGDARRLRIAASDVSLARSVQKDTTILNSLPVHIRSIEDAGDAPRSTSFCRWAAAAIKSSRASPGGL